jgi:hypothetical protein
MGRLDVPEPLFSKIENRGRVSRVLPHKEVVSMEIAELANLLHETADHHDPYEKVAPKHDWWDWYAAYMSARQSGGTPEEASKAAARYMEEARGIRVP